MTRHNPLIDERSYGGLFLFSVAILIIVTGWVVYDEVITRRPWKAYQREFYDKELKRVERDFSEARKKLEDSAVKTEILKIEKELALAQKTLSGQEHQKALNKLNNSQSVLDELRQDLIFLRSERDEAYYFWKRGVHQGERPEDERINFEELSQKVSRIEQELKEQEDRVSVARMEVERFTSKVTDLTARREKITAGYDKLLRKKQALDEKSPVIKQVVIREFDVVDRCMSCHLAIDKKGYDGEADKQPFRTHPAFDVMLGKHQVNRFGCTVCHDGQGSQIKGVGRRPFNHGRNDPYWERPLLEKPFTESTCQKCHYQEWEIDQAPTLNDGKQLFSDLACYACHLTEGFEKARRIGPSLTGIKSKVNAGWLAAWLENPKALRARTRMPNSWPVDGKNNNERGGALKNIQESEVKAVAVFILSESATDFDPPDVDFAQGDPARGRKLFIDQGCLGCHRPEVLNLPPIESQALLKDYGPDLSYLGSKTNAEWIAAFLADPEYFFSETRMPGMTLSPDDISHITAFLTSLKRDETFEPPAGFGDSSLTEQGRELVSSLGCYGCHEITGFEDAVKVGPDLEGFGEKSPEFLAFGDTITDHENQTWLSWTMAKLDAPRIFSTEKIELWMPDNDLAPDEVLALAVFLKSQVSADSHPDYIPCLNETRKLKEVGERLIKEYNCLGCHVLEGRGGDLRRLIRDPGLHPPDLTREGAKTQPTWLFQFLKQPETLRPWMAMNMPDFGLTDDEADAFVRYFMVLSQKDDLFVEVPVEMDEKLLAETTQAFITLKCLQCHQLTLGEGQVLSDLAPDMALTRSRLRPDWMEEFIMDPQWLMPETKMPTFFPLEDEDDPDSMLTPLPNWLGGDAEEQIKAIRDYLYLMESQDMLIVESTKQDLGD